MEDKEFNNIYHIPANYTDSGKLLGGMLEVRNTVEAIFLVLLVGYPELMWMPVHATMKIVIMVVTLLPLGVVALMGISGDSLGQYLYHMLRHWKNRRKLHMRRVRRAAPAGNSSNKPFKKDGPAPAPKGVVHREQ